MKRKNTLYLILLLLGAILIRIGYIFAPHMDSDQAAFALAGWHVLKGIFPVFQWSYHYMGTLQSYMDALFFALFGLNREALNTVPLLLSLIFICVTYRLAKEVMNKEAARIAALFSAFGPYYLVFHGAWARHGYLETMIFGSLLMIFTLQIALRNPTQKKRRHLFIAFGLVAGLGWWTNFLIAYYIAACGLFLLIYDKKLFFRKEFYLMLLTFFVGSLPFWIYNFQHSFASLAVFSSKSDLNLYENIVKLFTFHLPIVLGARSHNLLIFKTVVISLYSIVLIWFCTRKHSKPFLLLFFFIGAFFFAFTFTRFAQEYTQRYLLPLYSVLPIFIARFYVELKAKKVWLAYIFLGLLLFLNLQDNSLSHPWIHQDRIKRYREDIQNKRQIAAQLNKKKIFGAYSDSYWIGLVLTFDCQEKVVFSHPFLARNPLYTRRIDSQWNVAYLTVGGNIKMEKSFSNLNVKFNKFLASPYTFYDSFKHLGPQSEEISPENWKVTSSADSTETDFIKDQNLRSAWMTKGPQTKGMTLTIELPKIEPLTQIELNFGNARKGVPRGIEVAVSKNGKKWKTISTLNDNWGFFWSGTHPFDHGIYGRTELAFDPVRSKFVRFTLTKVHPDRPDYWAFAEVVLSRALKIPFQHLEPMSLNLLINKLHQQPHHTIYASKWLTAFLKENYPRLLVADSWKAWVYKDSFAPHLIDFSESVILIANRSNYKTIHQTLKKANIKFKQQQIDQYTLFKVFPSKTKTKWYWTGKQLYQWKKI